jgi:hypothetical protein
LHFQSIIFIPKLHCITTTVNPMLCAESIAPDITNVSVELIVCSSAKGLGNAGGKEFDLFDISNTCSMSAALTYPTVGDLSKSLVIMVMMRSLDLYRESLLPLVYSIINIPNVLGNNR